MKYITAFLKDVKNSFFSPTAYKQAAIEPTSNRVWFLTKVNIVTYTIIGLGTLLVAAPTLLVMSKNEYVKNHYPDDLVVTIADGTVSVNQEVPIIIESDFSDDTGQENLLVIDTSDNLSIEAMKNYNSVAVVTKDSLVVFNSDTESRIFSLTDSENFEITKDKAIAWGKIAIFWASILIVPVVLLMIALITGFALGYYLVISFGIALVTLALISIMGKKIEYWEAYKITLLALVPAIILDYVITFSGLPTFGFWNYLVVTALVIAINVYHWKDENPAPAIVDIPPATT